MEYSIVEFTGDSNSSCGYCKSPKSNHNVGIWAYALSVADYQDLIDRGWRRSGHYCYKPCQTLTCCPLYTIRCNALDLKLSKSQKKILKKVGKYLIEGDTSKTLHPGDPDSGNEIEPSSCNMLDKNISHTFEQKSNEVLKDLMDIEASTYCGDVLTASGESRQTSCKNKNIEGLTETVSQTTSETQQHSEGPKQSTTNIPKPGVGRDISKPECKKAKLVRLEKKQNKMIEKGLCVDTAKKSKQPSEKSLEDFIRESQTGSPVNKLELRLVRSFPRSSEFENTFKDEHKLYQKYQVAVHKDPIQKVSEEQFTRFLVSTPLKMRLLPSNDKEPLIIESWLLYRKYQMAIHNDTEDECCYSTFNSFLVESPLKPQKKLRGKSCPIKTGYGSFHHQYWLNGKLIAVGVIDVLPKCVSSVYFFYDPDYSFLSLGTYGSLREIELVRSLQKESPDISYYYMGYYIHSCPKMRYKARYSPSTLLCSEVYSWHPIAECQKMLDRAKYCRFNDDPSAVCEDSLVFINEVQVLYNHSPMSYPTYVRTAKGLTVSDEEEVRRYAELVGRKCAKHMLLYRQP